jgi:Protein of unknown function (DUF1214)
MNIRLQIASLLAALLSFCSAYADDSAATADAAQEWRALVEPLLPIGERIAAGMSDLQDPQLRQEIYRQLFSGVSAAYMGSFLGDTSYPDFWPVFNQAYNFLSPNPDDAYYLVPLDGKGVYKISGYRGTVHIADFEVASGDLFPRGTGTLGPVVGHYDLDTLHIKKDGSFEVILSPERPAGYKGDWWKLDAKATYVLVRQIAYDWLREVDGRFAIERLDLPAIRPRMTAQQIEAKLKNIANWAENWTKFSSKWIEGYRKQGLVNKVVVHFLPGVGGFSVQRYIEGLFELEPDEALIYETEIPQQCRYWNIELTDMLMSAIDYTNRQSSLNGFTARLDKDGKFRAVISATDPGVPNWLDTGGYAKGTMFGRWTECDSGPVPTVTKVKLVNVRTYLPADTPVVTTAARDASLRLRRKGAQLRRRW